MMCPVCKGSGVSPIPHFPDGKGGWLDETYYFLGLPCGGCNGTGVVPDGPRADPPLRSSKKSSAEGPSSLEDLQLLYAKAVADARRSRQNLLDELWQRQQEKRTRLEWSSFWKLTHWAEHLDVEAPGVKEEIAKQEAEWKARAKERIASALESLHGWCALIADFRFLIEMKQEKPTGETK
jgi:hypothetical protein